MNSIMTYSKTIKPYLKWAGGKQQIVIELLKLFPEDFNNYLEPFLGGGAVFFNLFHQIDNNAFLSKKKVFLNDLNSYLVNTYVCLAENTTKIVFELNSFEKKHFKNPEEYYYSQRKIFNDFVKINKITKKNKFKLAALFIYLNKSCFNGLWRVNKKNLFNVPWNKLNKVSLYNLKNIQNCSHLLKKYVILSKLDFYEFVKKKIKSNDPPYIPLSTTANFSNYTKNSWTDKDNERLRDILFYVDKIGGKFMMTNSNSLLSYKLFGQWKIKEIKVHRFIKALKKEKKRKKIKEVIITNY